MHQPQIYNHIPDDLAMERLRADLLRRARSEREGGGTGSHEAVPPRPATMEMSFERPPRLLFGPRPLVPSMLRRQRDAQEDAVASPKTPEGFERASTFPPNAPLPPASRGSSQPTTLSQIRTFDTPDPAEVHLARLAEEGRMMRASQSQTTERRRPRKFMFCFPHVKSRRVRTQILHCFVSGSFLILLLTIYLALSMTNNINSREMTIMLILVILFGTIFFCHGLMRLVILVARGDRERVEQASSPTTYAPMQGYAVPSRPVPVILARDEEAVSVESEVARPKPPAYGAWRESVRVDPDRFFWQRNESADPIPARPEMRRPPSYISEDGVSYVVEATPRSTVPTWDVPLSPHPFEQLSPHPLQQLAQRTSEQVSPRSLTQLSRNPSERFCQPPSEQGPQHPLERSLSHPLERSSSHPSGQLPQHPLEQLSRHLSEREPQHSSEQEPQLPSEGRTGRPPTSLT